MTHYINIKFLLYEEGDLAFLRNTLFTKLHKALFDLKSTDIGVSFPRADQKLGCMVRLHSGKESLQELQERNWLGGLSDRCQISDILPVPDTIKGYQVVSRIQPNMRQSKLRRIIKRSQKSENEIRDDEVKNYEAKMFEGRLSNPYLELRSTSNSQLYRIYIAFGTLLQEPQSGEFDQFGLSKTATVPIFDH